MKEAKFLLKTHPKWLTTEKASASKPLILLSQKFGLSRNVKKYPFLESATSLEKDSIYSDILAAVKKSKVFDEKDFVEMNLATSSDIIAMLLFEKDIISSGAMSEDYTRGVIAQIDSDKPTVVVNTKNHLDLIAFSNFGDEEKTLAKLNEFDNILGEELLFAYDSRLGFLSSKPENCGTGLFVETIVHTPGLILCEEMSETLNGISLMGGRVQGLYNERAEAWGAFFKITIDSFSGLSESELIQKSKDIQTAVIVAETKARKRLFKEAKYVMEDKIYRSFAMLKYARVLPLSQLFNFISMLRLGSECKVIDVPIKTLNLFFERGFSANLLLSANDDDKITDPDQIDIERANMYRAILSSIEV